MTKKAFAMLLVTTCLVTAVLSQQSEPVKPAASKEAAKMHGLIGKMTAVAGKRDELIAILLEGDKGEMPGCMSYIVAKDTSDADAIWITEVWDSPASHRASLSIPAVRQAITKGKPLIAAFGQSTITEPVGGHGLAREKD